MDLSGLSSITTASEMTLWLAANMVTPIAPAISGSDLGTILQKVLSLGGTPDNLLQFNEQTGDYTIAISDKAVAMNVNGDNTLTVPSNSTAAFPVGSQIVIMQSGSGKTKIAAASGVTINSANGRTSLRAQFSGATLTKVGTDTWWLSGDTTDSQLVAGKTTYINLTDTGHNATAPNWNNNLYFANMHIPLALLDTSGSSTGWHITAALGTAQDAASEFITYSFNNLDFPDDVLNSLWYVRVGSFSFEIAGLDPGKTYLVKVCSADNGEGDGSTRVTVGTAPPQAGASPDDIAVELIFTNITSDASGNLTIVVDDGAGAEFPLLNAMIITEIS